MDHYDKPPVQGYLAHHGIKGQRWGVRRYQNADGTWTAAGKERYGDGGELNRPKAKNSGDTRKKIAIGAAATAAVVTGTVLTAYLVKKYGGKSAAAIVNSAPVGKEIVEDIFKSTSIAETPVRQLPAPKVAPKRVLEEAAKSASSMASPIGPDSAPKVSSRKPSPGVSQPYSFESLMRENDDLLKKMLAELA